MLYLFLTPKHFLVHVFRGVLLIGAILYLFQSPEGVAADATGQTIIIRGDRNIGTPRLRQGFLHGITYEKGKNYSKTIDLISALKPKSWRLGNHRNNVYIFVVGEAKLPQKLGMEIVFTIQDAFNVRHGYDIKIGSACPPKRKNCFSSYDTFKKSWEGLVLGIMKTVAERKIIVDWFDVFGEPMTGATKLTGLTPEQFGDIFKTTHDIVRHYRPEARIVAPSFAGFNVAGLNRFLAFVAENSLRLDALSWHEFKTPEVLPSHVNEIREFSKTQPRLCKPTCPEIHINEYAPYDQTLIPGYGVGWLYYLEKAGVDHANRACWNIPKNKDTCWSQFNGMLLPDNVTPQPLYWVYKAYADMNDARVSSESSIPQTIAIASKDDAKKEFRILAGKYGQKGASGKVAIEVRDYPYSASSVSAEISRILDTGNTVQSLPSPPSPKTEVIRVQDRAFSIVIADFRDGEGYSIVVRPGGAGTTQ